MWNFIGEIIIGTFLEGLRELLLQVFQYIGASGKWTFYLGRRKFAEILDSNGNGRLGFFICLFIGLVIFILQLIPIKAL